MILIFIVYLLFASTFTLSKTVLFYCAPLFFIGVRMVTAGLLLLGYGKITKKNIPIAYKDYPLVGAIIFFHIFLAYVLEFIALTNLPSAMVCLWYNLSPFFTALFSYGFYRKTISKKQLLGIFVGFSAFMPIILPELLVTTSNPFYNFLLLVAVASSAYGWLIMKELIQKGYSYVLINGLGMFGGGLLALIYSLLFEKRPLIIEPIIPSVFSITFYGLLLIIIANIICYNLYGHLLSRYSPVLLSFAGLLTPLFAALFGSIFLGEIVKQEFFITLFILLFGLYIFSDEKTSD